MTKLICFPLFLTALVAIGQVPPTAASKQADTAPAPASAPSPSDCTTIAYNLMDCLSYLGVPSDEDKPDKGCCDAFKSVVDVDAECVCVAMEGSKELGLELNMTRALGLPSACKVKTPPLSCASSLAPGSAPASAPANPPASPNPSPPPNSPSPTPEAPPEASPAPKTGDCSTIIYNMADCLSFLGVPSDEDKPTKACCSGFKSVLDVDPQCICEAMESSKQLGIELNMTKAKTLPHACKIKTPPISCPASPGIAPAPGGSLGSPPPASGGPAPSTPPASGGAKAEAPAPTAKSHAATSSSAVSYAYVVLMVTLVFAVV